MDNSKKIPAIPTYNVRFENGTLQFDIRPSSAYSTESKCFISGGDLVTAQLSTLEKNEPVWIKIVGNQIVITKLTNYLVDKTNGYYVGGKIEEVARFNINA